MTEIIDTAMGSRGPVVIAMGNVPAPWGGEPVALEERTYLTADQTRAVPEGHPEARFLLGIPGDEIPMEHAVYLGLVVDEEDEEVDIVPESTAPVTPGEGAATNPAHDPLEEVSSEAPINEGDDELDPVKSRTPSKNKQRQRAQDK